MASEDQRPGGDEAAPESVNREQLDEGQAQEVADDARHPGRPLGESRRAPGDPGQVPPDDVPDLVDTMTGMVRSGRIDNGAFAGEPQHDDEADILGDTEDADDEALFNELADGSEDPLADSVDLSDIADDGDDPLGRVASEHGLEDEGPEDDDEDYDDADDDDLNADDDGDEDDDLNADDDGDSR